MSSGMSWRIETQEGASRIGLLGEFSESSDFEPLIPHLTPKVTFDVSGIERINSCGVREWVKFVERLEKSGHQLTLDRCSVPFVAQLNMIANFRGNAVVRSVFAPYYCPKCEANQQKLIELAGDPMAALTGETACPSCGEPMEFDDMPEMFLQFHSSGGP